MLRARFQAEQREAATGVAAGGTTEANPEAEAGGSGAPVQNPSSRRTTTVREPAAHTEGVRSLVVRAEGSRPAADVAEDLARTKGARPLKAWAGKPDQPSTFEENRSVLDLSLTDCAHFRESQQGVPLHDPRSAPEVLLQLIFKGTRSRVIFDNPLTHFVRGTFL